MGDLSSLSSSFVAEIDVISLIVQLSTGLAIGYLLASVVVRFSKIVGNKEQYFVLFPILIPTVILVISVIKSSLALSLGLVGALSIVRFRTPVKESEELVYIFIAIAVGIGIGAGQIVATLISSVFLISVIILNSLVRKSKQLEGVYLDIVFNREDRDSFLKEYAAILKDQKVAFELKRYEELDESTNATYYIEPKYLSRLEQTLEKLRGLRSDVQFTVINRSHNFG